jgi:6-phosphogluconolactonase (cycloisomerase 2 family)
MNKMLTRGSRVLLGLHLIAAAKAQSDRPAFFVANNGNNEGAVTSFVLDTAARPVFVQKLVTGGAGQPGTNAYSIDITPDGRFLATSHTTAATTEQITIIEVHADATMTIVRANTTPDSPLDLKWINDDLLAVTRTQFGGTNQVIVYSLNRATGLLTELDRGAGGTFTSAIDVHPTAAFLYAGDSNDNFIRVFSIASDGSLTEVETVSTGATYPLGVEITADGSRLYAGGGISNGRHAILGYAIAADGRLSPLPGMPYVSSGDSPFNINHSVDGAVLFAGHGADATIRSFLVNAETGELLDTGSVFDCGTQGSFGDSASLGDVLLVTDDFLTPNGLYSFVVDATGGFVSTGPMVDTGATAPLEIAVWSPPSVDCPADLNGDGQVDLTDLATLVAHFGLNDATHEQGDVDGDGDVDLADLAALLVQFGTGC